MEELDLVFARGDISCARVISQGNAGAALTGPGVKQRRLMTKLLRSMAYVGAVKKWKQAGVAFEYIYLMYFCFVDFGHILIALIRRALFDVCVFLLM